MRIHAMPLVLGTFAVAITTLALLGWAFDVHIFHPVLAQLPAMVPLTAVALMLQGLAVLMFARAPALGAARVVVCCILPRCRKP